MLNDNGTIQHSNSNKAVDDMATKSSCLLFISLVVMLAIVSADRLRVVDRNPVSESIGVPSTDAIGVPTTDANANMMGKLGSVGKTNNNENKMNGMNEVKALANPMMPLPVPGADGQFQFQLGPIGFGWNWNFGGGLPGPLIAYSQPIVVSPYSTPSNPPFPYMGVLPSPYANVQPYQRPPVPGYFGFNPRGYFQRPSGRYGPYPPGQYGQGANQIQHPASGHD